METVTVLMIGDVVGEAGMALVKERLRPLSLEYGAALTVVNGENAAAGYGLTEALANEIFDAGADIITSGNHIWEKREFWQYMDDNERVLRPANYPPQTCGRGLALIEKAGLSFAVINLQGRKHMTAIDCPFKCFDSIYETLSAGQETAKNGAAQTGTPPCPIILVDFHAEASDEKEALGLYIDGRAAVIAGTHTHVQTADEKILPHGTAYITDLGMTGASGAVIGMKAEPCVSRFVSHIQARMECASENPALQGIAVKIDAANGRSVEIRRI
ncbi:MAG: YmdB family metallophosphoesterase [Spirochaetaceae bacterium]|jgi:metallophosphoesterase (TIGR00282 family)|nr:YmdB family metallophosphoesterase [Spirochaetaceae bacterium]